MKPVIYEPHPVSLSRKLELIRLGFKIIDAIFAPADYVHPDNVKLERKARKATSDDGTE